MCVSVWNKNKTDSMCVRNRDEERDLERDRRPSKRERVREKEERVRSSNKQQHWQNKWLFSFHNIQGFEEFSCTDIILTNVHIDQTTAFQHFSHKEISFMIMQNKSFKGLLDGTGAADQHVLNNWMVKVNMTWILSALSRSSLLNFSTEWEKICTLAGKHL